MALVSCPECQAQVSDRAESCPHCGYPLRRSVISSPPPAPLSEKSLLADNPHYSASARAAQFEPISRQQVVKSAKSRGVYIILGLLFGFVGIHNFYAGYLGRGAAQFLIVAILGWYVIGFVIVFFWILIEFFTITHDSVGDKMV